MTGDAAGEHQRLGLRARLGEAALNEQDVQPFLHRASVVAGVSPSSAEMAGYVLRSRASQAPRPPTHPNDRAAAYTARPSRSGPKARGATGSSLSLASVSSRRERARLLVDPDLHAGELGDRRS